MSWTFHITERWEDIWNEGFQKKWLNLLDTSSNPHVFFHPALVKAWVDTYIPIRKIFPIFIWGESDNNEAFLPLIFWHKNWKNAFLKVIIPAGYSDFDYHDPIFKDSTDKEAIVQFWNELLPILNKYHHDKIILDGLHGEFIPKTFATISDEPCPFLDLTNIKTEHELMNFFSTSLRGDIRRQIRRLNEIGTLTLHEYSSYNEVLPTFNRFLTEHTNKWPNAYKAPLFHINLIKEGLGSVVHFSSIDIDNTPVAWHLGFELSETYYYYMPAGDFLYSKFSPVKIHLYHLIKRAIELGYHKYDHLRGEETYKQGWSNGIEKVYYCEKSKKGSYTKMKLTIFRLRELTKL